MNVIGIHEGDNFVYEKSGKNYRIVVDSDSLRGDESHCLRLEGGGGVVSMDTHYSYNIAIIANVMAIHNVKGLTINSKLNSGMLELGWGGYAMLSNYSTRMLTYSIIADNSLSTIKFSDDVAVSSSILKLDESSCGRFMYDDLDSEMYHPYFCTKTDIDDLFDESIYTNGLLNVKIHGGSSLTQMNFQGVRYGLDIVVPQNIEYFLGSAMGDNHLTFKYSSKKKVDVVLYGKKDKVYIHGGNLINIMNRCDSSCARKEYHYRSNSSTFVRIDRFNTTSDRIFFAKNSENPGISASVCNRLYNDIDIVDIDTRRAMSVSGQYFVKLIFEVGMGGISIDDIDGLNIRGYCDEKNIAVPVIYGVGRDSGKVRLALAHYQYGGSFYKAISVSEIMEFGGITDVSHLNAIHFAFEDVEEVQGKKYLYDSMDHDVLKIDDFNTGSDKLCFMAGRSLGGLDKDHNGYVSILRFANKERQPVSRGDDAKMLILQSLNMNIKVDGVNILKYVDKAIQLDVNLFSELLIQSSKDTYFGGTIPLIYISQDDLGDVQSRVGLLQYDSHGFISEVAPVVLFGDESIVGGVAYEMGSGNICFEGDMMRPMDYALSLDM